MDTIRHTLHALRDGNSPTIHDVMKRLTLMFTGAAVTVMMISMTDLFTGTIIIIAFGLGLTTWNIVMCLVHLISPTTTRNDDRSQDSIA